VRQSESDLQHSQHPYKADRTRHSPTESTKSTALAAHLQVGEDIGSMGFRFNFIVNALDHTLAID